MKGERRFDGAVYEPRVDDARLTGQIVRIYAVLANGGWYTLAEIAAEAQAPEASVSAQLRHLRKPKHGAHVVEKRHRGAPRLGLWEYALLPMIARHAADPVPQVLPL